MKKYLIITTFLVMVVPETWSQVDPLWVQDTTFVKELYIMKNKFQSLSFTGYLQIQFQHAESAGISSYNGGDFAAESDSRFMIRRGRFRLDYERRNQQGFYRYNFALQFDGTEKGVNIRDMFGRIYENKWHNLVATFGVFNRPFGYELNYSSSLRESPERGRMSQILMKTERDIGAMLSFEPQDRSRKYYPLKIDAAVFNGQGLNGLGEFDSFKDFVARASLRKTEIADKTYLSGGVSYLNGGFVNGSDIYFNTVENTTGFMAFAPDTSSGHIGSKSPRIYYGADLQVSWDNALGKTELRGEFIAGTQSATAGSSVTPPVPPQNSSLDPAAIYIRNFNGAYFYLLQTFLKKHQVFLKYDWYDPNTKVDGSNINAANNFGAADLRYDTYGIGYVFYANDNLKFSLFYEHPVNEGSSIDDYAFDLPDDTYTLRLQYRF
ncbi:MAG: hypothetical protein MUD02_06470 [Bacteroidales bacterium]|nr:hypothetical protein [Bacteroidales bacterium]